MTEALTNSGDEQPAQNMAQKRPGTGTLKTGLTIAGTVHRDFVLREATLADLTAAELEAKPANQIAFSAAMLAQQLVRIGSYEGPFTASMLQKLPTSDFWRLRAAQEELEALGES